MNARNVLGIVVAIMVIVAACNYTEGDCYPVGQSDGPASAEVGVGVGVGSGAGGYGFGDAPKSGGTGANACNMGDLSDDSSDGTTSAGSGAPGNTCVPGFVMDSDGLVYSFCGSGCNDPACVTFGSFSSAAFTFVVIIPDDGKDDAGGWQEASSDLKFVRWTSVVPEYWKCHVTVGMAIRSKVDGVIAPSYAAAISAAVATQVSANIKASNPDIPSGIFCSKLVPGMDTMIKKLYSTLGPTVKQ